MDGETVVIAVYRPRNTGNRHLEAYETRFTAVTN